MENKIGSQRIISQRGGVSIFVVIFAILLFSVITLSFASVMQKELQRSVDGELSQSALDSALAGVEDAKRAIAKCDKAPASAGCDKIYNNDCKAIPRVGIAGSVSEKETKIQREVSSVDTGADVNLAYTCVTMTDKVPNYEGKTDAEGGSISVPLRGESEVRKIRVEWHADKDFNAGFTSSGDCKKDEAKALCRKDQWAKMPALIRAQLVVVPGSSFSLSDLDDNSAKMMFLRPIEGSATGTNIVSHQIGSFSNLATPGGIAANAVSPNTPLSALCRLSSSANYKCAVDLELPSSKYIPANSKLSMLRLTTMYNKSSLRVTMLDASNNPINFLGVQTIVDSTGRANDVFRRVEARLEPRSFKDMAIPDYAMDLGGSLCKDFSVIHEANASFPRSDNCKP